MAGKPRILVVEDEVAVSKMICKRLELTGYEVLAAYDGWDGLTKAREQQPDLIVLDLMMPKLNGYEVCTLLKRDRLYESIPIIILTAKSKDSDKDEGMACGADAYMTKPFKSEVLLDLIQTFLTKRPGPPASSPVS